MKATPNEDGAEVAEDADDAELQPNLLRTRGHRLEAVVDLASVAAPPNSSMEVTMERCQGDVLVREGVPVVLKSL